jgi:hypothetical protein
MKDLPLTSASSVEGQVFYLIVKHISLRQPFALDIIELLKKYIATHPDIEEDRNSWIEGMGWDQTKWEGKQFPTAVFTAVLSIFPRDLQSIVQGQLDSDPILNGRLISLRRVDGHVRWVSGRVLEVMGNLPKTIDGGEIIRYASGAPTGVFVDNAQDLIPAPGWSEKQRRKFFETAMRDALSHGLTSIHDADARLDHIDTFRRKVLFWARNVVDEDIFD